MLAHHAWRRCWRLAGGLAAAGASSAGGIGAWRGAGCSSAVNSANWRISSMKVTAQLSSANLKYNLASSSAITYNAMVMAKYSMAAG